VNKINVNEFISLFANTGFPVAITAYLLIRLEKQLLGLTASINRLNTIISAKLGVVIDFVDDKNSPGA
jgi:YvrJ protein family